MDTNRDTMPELVGQCVRFEEPHTHLYGPHATVMFPVGTLGTILEMRERGCVFARIEWMGFVVDTEVSLEKLCVVLPSRHLAEQAEPGDLVCARERSDG